MQTPRALATACSAVTFYMLALAWIGLVPSPTHAGTPLPDLITKGKYIFAAAGGCGCHTEMGKTATGLNAGGRRYDGPFGTVYAPNIPPKNMISVSRKTHIPSVAESNCWAMSSK